MPSLMWLFLIPLMSAAILIFFPEISQKKLKRFAVILSLIPLALLLYHPSTWIGSNILYPWFSPLGINFHLSVDTLSLLFLFLTAIIIPVSLSAAKNLNHPNIFYALVLTLQGLLIGFFTARDLAVFTIFWEAMLLPLFFIIHLWGGPQRHLAAIKFLLYMIAGSIFMVAAILALYLATNSSFNMDTLAGIGQSKWIFAAFVLAFAVKTPLFPFHAWLPDAYTQANTSGTILLSAILSKAGIYGFFRIGMEIFPGLMKEAGPLLLGLAIAGVFYGAFAAWKQTDYKKLLAYSSFSHVNFILAGAFIWDTLAHTGAVLQALNHGITIAALFLVAGWLEERLGNTRMNAGGLAKYFPYLCWLTLFFALSSVALPGTNNFIGELLIFFGLFIKKPWLTALFGLTVILSVVYMLRWIQTMYFEEPHNVPFEKKDITIKDLAVALPLIALILWVGIYPAPLLNRIEPAVKIEESK